MSPAPQPQTLTATNVRDYVRARLDLEPGVYATWRSRVIRAQTAVLAEPSKKNQTDLETVLAAEPRTASALARALGMSKYALNRRLWHGLPFSFDEVVRLADYFHTSTDELRGHGAQAGRQTP